VSKEESFSGLARRWMKKTVEELTATDRNEREAADFAQQRAEQDMREKATEEAWLTAIPGLRDLKERQEADRIAGEERREAEHAAEIGARPLAGVGLTITGDVEATWAGQLPALVERIAAATPDPEELEYDPWAGEARLRVELTSPPASQPVIGGLPLAGWSFVIPGYDGPGTYDLMAIGQQRSEAGVDLDAAEYAFALGGWDDPFYWYSQVPGSIEVGADERALVVRMSAQSAMGSVDIVASINLPA
jgi:hypothetical protein